MLVIVLFAALLGLAIGSFLNVVIWRVPAGRSVVSPGSACPSCGQVITARDNIPVLSWVLLRGRCRGCAKPISIRYPAVEMATAAAFVAVTVWMMPHWQTLAFLYLAAVSIALAMIDIDVRRLPDVIVLPSYLVGAGLLTLAAFVSGDLSAVARAGAGLVIMLTGYGLVWLIANVVYRGRGMGLGDVKLAGLLGLYLGYLGWRELATGAFLAFLVGGLVGIVLMLRGGRKVKVPFGPYMLAGAWLGVFVGVPLANWYLGVANLS